MTQSVMTASLKLFSCLLLCLVTALIGGWFTEEAYNPWYMHLNKPFWTVPGWVIPMIWTPLYILMGLSLWLITMTTRPKPSLWPYFWFLVQLGLNLAWSPAFFFLECSLCGFYILMGLLVAIAITIFVFRKYSGMAAFLLIPYFLWVAYMGLVNITIYSMN